VPRSLGAQSRAQHRLDPRVTQISGRSAESRWDGLGGRCARTSKVALEREGCVPAVHP